LRSHFALFAPVAVREDGRDIHRQEAKTAKGETRNHVIEVRTKRLGDGS
jgi:hypothetical protein